MEVDQQHRAAAPHHPVRGDRRIDAARQQAREPPAGAGRQAAGARLLAEEVERVRRAASRCGSSAPDRSRSTCQPVACLISPPTSRSICGDVSGNRLSARRDADAKRRAAADRRGRSRIAAASASKSCGAAAGIARSSRCRTRGRSARATSSTAALAPSSISMRPMTERTLRDVETRQRRPEIAHQQLDEPGPVASLERELLVVNDDGIHESVMTWLDGAGARAAAMAAADGAFDRRRQAGVDPVAGEEQSRHGGRRAPGAAAGPGASENVARGSRIDGARARSWRVAARAAAPRRSSPMRQRR